MWQPNRLVGQVEFGLVCTEVSNCSKLNNPKSIGIGNHYVCDGPGNHTYS
nr:hypothetical protein Itr_chr09CG02330 [Ipomoea trifida]